MVNYKGRLGGALKKITKVTASGSSTTLSSGTISTTYDNYVVYAELKSTAAVWRVQFNSDTSTNYDQGILENGVHAAGSARVGIAGSFTGGTATRQHVTFWVRNSTSGNPKSCTGSNTLENGTNALYFQGNWSNTSNLINEIILENATQNWSSDSYIVVFGFNDE